MRLFKINELSHSFIGRKIFDTGKEDEKGVSKRLFEKASVMICDKEHIGLVGPNGCGKSTFLKILTGEVVPDVLDIEILPNIKIGWLDQYANIDNNLTIYEYLASVFSNLFETDGEVAQIYANLHELDEQAQIKALNKAERLNEFLIENKFDSIPKKIENVIVGLGFSPSDLRKQIGILSGGQKTKIILAKILLSENDILILDEPTNFLDMKYIEWLGYYLKKLKYSFIVISHDRAFLNKIADKIIEIANGKFKLYEGDYDYYLKEKERREAVQSEQQKAQEKYIVRSEAYVQEHLYYNSTGAGKTKATWLKKMLDTLERIEIPEIIVKPDFKFKHKKGALPNILKIENLEIGYDNKAILPPVSLTVNKGDKIILKGFNGIGKTTLLKTINEDIPAVSGFFEYGEYIESVFLKQEEDYENNFSNFDKSDKKSFGLKGGKQREITVTEFAKEYYPEVPTGELQKNLRSCGLTEQHFFEQVRRLSGGEMTKLRMALAMRRPVNLIILDEPTNHLDIYSKEVLTHALDEFEGTVIMTTHDVNFDISWATNVFNIEDLLR
ncbi:ABC transporter ATP-binding protein [Clostridia bacterium]|nr:ABC transporter ATP-binding protein [Clostridia bacterium]